MSTSQEVGSEHQVDKNNPSGTSQQNIKYARFEGFTPNPEYLHLLSSYLPNVETIIWSDQGYSYYRSRYSDAHQRNSYTFNLTGFQKLKNLRINIQALAQIERHQKAFDYLLIHFKFVDGDEASYSVQGEGYSYNLTSSTQQFVLDSSRNEELSTKLLTFECKDKLEEFSLCCYIFLCW